MSLSIKDETLRKSPLWTKDVWGPKGWRWLHILAIDYPAKPTAADMRRTAFRIHKFLDNLPCVICSTHAKEYYKKYPLRLGSSHQLQVWVWQFHNAVNLRLDKPYVTYKEYLKLYMSEICWASWSQQCQKLSDGE
jgi:FAD-linked sulfhydryl oxidase